ncbi:glycogen/starch/alpha-glucan family phosphorylase [Olsenella uli]|uniref:glycogen/starch/alpha-glucan phosphorylase n=1 Tax=Olsenella uli TaxID=133926 RepID=UPI0019560C97|nr:glycogen/starch/alpha-glucan phosphorylase [Olsenella uli]MBM6675475.1 glycogen/starch/alpha-glucan family phosphorylase [Olsenella uli]
MDFENRLNQVLADMGTSLDDASNQQVFCALLRATRDVEHELAPAAGDRKLYYFSAEFLVGRLLHANLVNLGLADEVERVLAAHGTSLAAVEDCEPEPSLGNGGLGRLAACFLDSIASLGLPGDGVGLNYHYGLFRQDLTAGVQREEPNPWIEPESWLLDSGRSFSVPFGFGPLTARMYDIEVPGYENGVVNRLHLFDVEDPASAPEHGIAFDKRDVAHSLTSFLYPDDSDEDGRLLRVYQQYFMVSAGAQLILAELEERGFAPEELADHVAVHINDTHPSMVIPELVRLLMERGVSFEDAADIVERTCAYTNHTILAEALETWPMRYLEQVAPGIVPVIRQLDALARTRTDNDGLAVIDGGDVVHMANLDVHFSHAVNGVAALHTQILVESEMRPFAELYPGKFSNKTNGVTFRRWLMGCNPALAELVTDAIGDAWKRDAARLEDLLALRDDAVFVRSLLDVKVANKKRLAAWLAAEQGIQIDPHSVLDIQVKRMHQYKRQQMNALYAIWKYLQIKRGNVPNRPVTMVFGAKAAPAYALAKDTIALLLALGRLIAEDPQVSPWLRLVFVENYNVTAAEHLIPAADVSEQISLASKEASGTSNMKFMANGAVTLGTLDGANVEIADLVGHENIYLFGRSSEDVIGLYARGDYRPWDYWQQDGELAEVLDFICSPELLACGDAGCLTRVYRDFVAKDYFMALLDARDYVAVKERCLADYEDRAAWGEKALVNVAKSGFFSSDRTIREYDRDIWHLS